MNGPLRALRPEPSTTVDGVPFSARYGDVYASREGALGQARHVFLGGCGLPQAWAQRRQFVVLETGFGLGTNMLATWAAWRADPQRPARLHLVSVEAHPLAAADLVAAAVPELRPLAEELAARWPLLLPGLHPIELAPGVQLTLAFGDAQQMLPQLVCGADAIYLDGFAPARNPALWSLAALKQVARCARPGARLATWCTAGVVQHALAEAGFELARQPGFGHKREMLVGRFAPRWRVRRHEPPSAWAGPREAVVIGAGLAGCSAAAALAARGWTVTVLDAHQPAAGASALPWGLLHPTLAADDSVLARLSRAGFFTSRTWLASLATHAPALWQPAGVLQQATSEAEAAQFATIAQALGCPPLARWVEADEAAALLGVTPRRGGLWFADGAAVAVAGLCRALLERPAVRVLTDVAAERLVRVGAAGAADAFWRVCDAAGRVRAQAPVVVVANALDAPRLLGLRHAPLSAVRGRISLIDAAPLRALRAGLTGGGTLLHAADGHLGVGASYELSLPDAASADDAARLPAELVHAGNLQRLARMLAQPVKAELTGVFDGVRCVAPDRLPLAGAVPDERAARAAAAALRGAHLADLPRQPGLYLSCAMASRGLTLAPLAAELLAAQIEGEPWPAERDLAAALDPARALLRRLRRGAPIRGGDDRAEDAAADGAADVDQPDVD